MRPFLRKLVYLCAPLLVVSSLAVGDIFKANSLQASSDGVNVTLRWVTDDETNIARFEIERSSAKDGNYVTIASVDPKGPSLYEFIDNTAFQRTTTVYQYRIKVIFTTNQAPFYSPSLVVSHTVSGVRRTWGSIKSLFR